MKFTAGQFNRFGKVYRLKEGSTINSAGHLDESDTVKWRLVGTRHFNIVPQSSKEFMLGDQLNNNTSHQLTTTYDSQSKTFNEQFAFIYQGRQFNFTGSGLNVEERNRWLSFPATEMVPAMQV